jgi:hypothetical protein
LRWFCPDCRHPCKSLSRGNALLLTRASEERAKTYKQIPQRALYASRPLVPAFAEPDIHSLSRARRPSQMIEFVFAASPETIRRSLGSLNSFAQSATCRTWQPARLCNLVVFPCGQRLGCCVVEIFRRYKRPPLPIDRKQIHHHLSSYRERGTVRISFLLFLLINQCQFMALFRCQFRGFHQHSLDVFVALFWKEVSVGPYLPNSFRLRTSRSN